MNTVDHPAFAEGALEEEGRLAFGLRRSEPDDPRVVELYDRFLPAALKPPFNKTIVAFLWAQRLRAKSNPQEAIRYYRMVPKTDRNYLSAQYYMMSCLQDLLDKAPADSVREQLASDIEAQAAVVRPGPPSSAKRMRPIARPRLRRKLRGARPRTRISSVLRA